MVELHPEGDGDPMAAGAEGEERKIGWGPPRSKGTYGNMVYGTASAHVMGGGAGGDQHSGRWRRACEAGLLNPLDNVLVSNPAVYTWATRCNACCLSQAGHTRNAFSKIVDAEVAAHMASAKHQVRVAQYRVAKYWEVHGTHLGMAHEKGEADAW